MLALRGLGVFVILILIWEITVIAAHLPNYILPSPREVFLTFITQFPLLWENTIPTLIEIICGLTLGVLVGILVALLMMSVHFIRYWLLPLIIVSQSLPTFAIAPLLVLWFGYGMLSKIITVMLMLFFPVSSAFYDGLRKTSADWLDMASTMNGKPFPILWHLRFPAALPQLAAGIRITAVMAPIGAIISEWVGASKGLGFLLLNANARLEIPLMFASLIIIMLVSLMLYGAVNLLLHNLIKW